MRKIQKIKVTFALSAVLLHPATDLIAQTWSAQGEFSATNNPGGVWSYGSSQTLGGPFTLNTALVTNNFFGLDAWLVLPPPTASSSVVHNGTTNPITAFGAVTLEPGQLGLHPGPGGEKSVVRFAAPAAGSYAVNAAFFGLDFAGPTTTDVHILVAGISIFDGIVNGFGPGTGPIFATNLNLNAGDTIDFAVGVGPNGNYANDLTGLAATVSALSSNPPALTIHPAVEICWQSQAGVQYQLQRSPSPHSAHWENVGTPVTGTGGELCATDPHRGFRQRIYRLQVLP